METVESCVENGKVAVNGDTVEQQYEVDNMMEHDDVDNNGFDFEAHFNGKAMDSADEYDDEDRSFKIR
jgi:hypothetical protein